MRKRPERAFPFLRGCAGMSDRRERKATPSGVFDWTQSGQSGAWGDPNGRIGKSEKDIPIHCSPFPSKPLTLLASQKQRFYSERCSCVDSLLLHFETILFQI